MFPLTKRRHADAADKPDQIHLHAGLITVTAGEHDARRVGTPAEFGTDGGVDLGVHQHEVLAVLEAVKREVTAELDGTGHVDDDVDPVGLGDGLEILRDGNRFRSTSLCREQPGCPPTTASSTPASESAFNAFSGDRTAMTDNDIPGTLLTIWFTRPRPMNPQPAMATRTGLPCLARSFRSVSTYIIMVYGPPLSATSAHWASLSEITATGSGHEMPNSGSSNRYPSSPAGACGPLT